MKNTDIAIIGGGASGMVLVIYLAELATKEKLNELDFTLHLIDPNGFGCGGIAYGMAAPEHILNTRRNEISPWDVNRFAEFLIQKGRSDDVYSFDLRSDCLEFLQHELQSAILTLQSLGVTVKNHQESAYVVAEETPGQFRITNACSQLLSPELSNLKSSQVVLAVGYGSNDNFSELRQYKGQGYIHSMYPHSNIALEPALQKSHPRIAVVGSGAALYDFILACPCQPDTTELFVFSHGCTEPLQVRDVTAEETFKRVAVHQLTQLDTSASMADIENAVNSIFDTGHKDDVGPDTWIAFNIMLVIGSVLEKISTDTAIQYRTSQSFAHIRRLGGPTSSVANTALNTFKPQFIPYNLSSENIFYQEDGYFIITVNNQTYQVDCIINATGHGRHNSPIIEKLKADGLAELNKNTGVLATDETGYRLKSSEIPCIGPAVHFGTDGIETFAKPAEALAHELLHDLI